MPKPFYLVKFSDLDPKYDLKDATVAVGPFSSDDLRNESMERFRKSESDNWYFKLEPCNEADARVHAVLVPESSFVDIHQAVMDIISGRAEPGKRRNEPKVA